MVDESLPSPTSKPFNAISRATHVLITKTSDKLEPNPVGILPGQDSAVSNNIQTAKDLLAQLINMAGPREKPKI